MDQIAVCGVNFEDIEAGFIYPTRGFAPHTDQGLYFCICKGARFGVVSTSPRAETEESLD